MDDLLPTRVLTSKNKNNYNIYTIVEHGGSKEMTIREIDYNISKALRLPIIQFGSFGG